MRELFMALAITGITMFFMPTSPQEVNQETIKSPDTLQSIFSGVFTPTPADTAVEFEPVKQVSEVPVMEYRDERIDDVLSELAIIRNEIKLQAQAHREASVVKYPEYPTISEIRDTVREVVKEELATVVLTLKVKEEEKKVTIPAPTVSSPESTFDLPPGAIITAIDGVPVSRGAYRSPAYTGSEYSTPTYRVRSFFNGRQMGAIRYGTCGPNGCN